MATIRFQMPSGLSSNTRRVRWMFFAASPSLSSPADCWTLIGAAPKLTPGLNVISWLPTAPDPTVWNGVRNRYRGDPGMIHPSSGSFRNSWYFKVESLTLLSTRRWISGAPIRGCPDDKLPS